MTRFCRHVYRNRRLYTRMAIGGALGYLGGEAMDGMIPGDYWWAGPAGGLGGLGVARYYGRHVLKYVADNWRSVVPLAAGVGSAYAISEAINSSIKQDYWWLTPAAIIVWGGAIAKAGKEWLEDQFPRERRRTRRRR